MKQYKKAQQINLQTIAIIALIFAVAILVTAFAGDVTEGIRDNFYGDNTNCEASGDTVNCTSAGGNVTREGLNGVLNIAGQFGNTGTVIAAGLIIGILIGAFAIGRGAIQLK